MDDFQTELLLLLFFFKRINSVNLFPTNILQAAEFFIGCSEHLRMFLSAHRLSCRGETMELRKPCWGFDSDFWSVSESLEALNEAAGEKSGAAGALQGSLVPAIVTLLVNKNDVALLQFDLSIALGRIRHNRAISVEGQAWSDVRGKHAL